MKGTITKKYRIIVNITALYVFIMTFVVSFILSLAQTNDSNLNGEKLLIFLCGFLGSVICIVIRYVFLYRNALSQWLGEQLLRNNIKSK